MLTTHLEKTELSFLFLIETYLKVGLKSLGEHTSFCSFADFEIKTNSFIFVDWRRICFNTGIAYDKFIYG